MEVWYWIKYRLFGRCYAQGCGRLMVLHTPHKVRLCEDTPLAIELTDPGWLYANGIDPDSEPVVPVSRAS